MGIIILNPINGDFYITINHYKTIRIPIKQPGFSMASRGVGPGTLDLVFIESQAAGLAVVGPRAVAVPLVVTEGQNGCLYTPLDMKDAKRAIKDIHLNWMEYFEYFFLSCLGGLMTWKGLGGGYDLERSAFPNCQSVSSSQRFFWSLPMVV